MKEAIIWIAITANGMAIAMLIFAPLERLFGLEIGVRELESVDVGSVEVEDHCDELLAVVVKANNSELCHHTGIANLYTA
jgi:hypothetical protein